MGTRRRRGWKGAVAILLLLCAWQAYAQQPAQSPLEEESAELERNRALAASMLARDNVQGVFVDVSTATGVALAHPNSRLVCAGAPESLHLYFSPPSPNVVSVRCVISLNDPSIGIFDLEIRATGLTQEAARTMREIGSPDLLGSATRSIAEMWGEEIHGQPWTGGRVEVGGGGSPPHPPYNIMRVQGTRDGSQVYLRVAWARVGDWMFIQRVEAPIQNQVAVEALASLQFYNTLLAAQPPAQ